MSSNAALLDAASNHRTDVAIGLPIVEPSSSSSRATRRFHELKLHAESALKLGLSLSKSSGALHASQNSRSEASHCSTPRRGDPDSKRHALQQQVHRLECELKAEAEVRLQLQAREQELRDVADARVLSIKGMPHIRKVRACARVEPNRAPSLLHTRVCPMIYLVATIHTIPARFDSLSLYIHLSLSLSLSLSLYIYIYE